MCERGDLVNVVALFCYATHHLPREAAADHDHGGEDVKEFDE